ncbi:hypothetical protein RQ734_17430 [Roseomonas mucosa]|uniref:hypothetical protein n=1 Tax=Roseomonas mucosa TaxID=207340 RepID=UPI001EF70C9A|nr:hypothetical protein [Roseomonas mucosa]MCG7353845.1 hypothetical protein [Roseomonas mucosa]MDT8277854.1 hypothetical protein [Roseomonas mucosa]
MSFVLIFDPEPLLSAPQFFGPFGSQTAAKRYAEATGMTFGRDFDAAAAEADSPEGNGKTDFPCAVASLHPTDGGAAEERT